MARQVGDRITPQQARPKPTPKPKAQPKPKPFVLKTPHDVGTTAQPKAIRVSPKNAAARKEGIAPSHAPRAPFKKAFKQAQTQGKAQQLATHAPKLVPLSDVQAPPKKGLYLSPQGHPDLAFKPGSQSYKLAASKLDGQSKLEKKLGAIGNTAAKTELAPAIFTLKQVGRPYHAIAAGANAAVQHKNVLKAAERGAELKDTSSFSDVLKSAGVKNKLVRGIAGTALDIGLDPTTYLTAGTGGIERKALTSAAEHAAESVTRKGVKVGMRVHVPLTNKTLEKSTSGKATAKLAEKLSNPVSRKVGAATKEQLRPIAPDLTPPFRTAEQHATIRAAERRYRASVASGERHISRRVQAYQKALKGEDQQGIVNAVEGAPKNLDQYRAYERAAKQTEATGRKFRGALKARTTVEARPRGAARAEIAKLERENNKIRMRVETETTRAKRANGNGDYRTGANGAQYVKLADQRIADNNGRIADLLKIANKEEGLVRGARSRARNLGQQVEQSAGVQRKAQATLNANRFDLSGLSEHEQSIAHSVIADFESELRQKSARGIGAGTFKATGAADAQGYFPHVNTKEFEQGTKTQQRAFPTMRAKLEKGRGIRKPLAVANAETPGLFEQNVPRALGQKLAKTNRSAALHDLWQHVASTGKPLTKDTPIDFEHERVYEVKPNGLTAIEDTHGGFDNKEAQNILAGKRKGHFVVLDKRSVADVERRLAASAPAESGVGRILDRTTGRLKYAATILNPSFQPRNLIGDSINAFMGDARGKAFGQAAKVLRTERAENKFEKSAAAITGSMPRDTQKLLDRKLHFPSGDQTYGDLLEEARREGAIDTGQAGTELRNQLAQGDASKLGKTYGIRAVNEYRENLPRLATYISAKARGMSSSEAAAWSLKHHFDYADLSPTERNVLRRAFPFYTFFARNTRLQAEKLLTRPGKLATISKILDESAKLAGYKDYGQYASQLQQGQQQGLPIPLRIHGVVYNAYASPPTTDLNQLTANPTQQFFNVAQRLTFYKTIPELITNYSVFFRGQIQNPQAPLVPAPAPAADLPGPVKKLLGLTTYVDKRSGKRILGWPAKVDYAFRQITPDVNTLGQLATPVPGSRGMSQKTQAISGLTGIRIAPLDQNTNQINNLYQQLNNATSQLDALNQRLGKTPNGHYPQPPESKKLRATIKTLNQKIGQLKSQRGDNPAGIATQQRPKNGHSSTLERQLQNFTGQGSGGGNQALENELKRFASGG